MAMPLAVAARLRREPSLPRLWLHVGLRGAGLIVLGLILANVDHADPARMRLNPYAWGLMGLLGGILFWLQPARGTRRAGLYRGLRWAGFALLVLTYALFRRTGKSGHAAWIDGSYPEILGLIGYTYLAAAVLYIPTRRWLWAPVGWCALALTYCALSTAKVLHFPPAHTPLYLWPFDNGAFLLVLMAGVATSNLFFGEHARQRTRALAAVGCGLAALLLAWALAPLGISKIRATPTWCLVSIGAGILLFTLLHWVVDVRGSQGWARLVRPAGTNTLLTYLLPDLYYFATALAGFSYFDMHASSGPLGVGRALVFTLGMLAIAGLLTRLGLRLQL